MQPGLELFFNSFLELIEYREESGRWAFTTLVAYADEYGFRGEQRRDLFVFMSGMLQTYNAHVKHRKQRQAGLDKLAAVRAARKAAQHG